MEFTYCDVWKFYSCNLCPYRTTSLLTVTNHIKQHRTTSIPAPFTCCSPMAWVSYKCEICGFETPLKVNLSNHVNIIHKKLRVKYDYVDILRNFGCGSCEFQTHSLLLMTKHAWNCTSKDELMVLMRSHGKVIKCKMCSFTTHERSLMRKHRRFEHLKIKRKCKFKRPRSPVIRPKIYRIPIEQLRNMYVTHRNSFMNKYTYRNNVYVENNAAVGHNGDQESEILLIPRKPTKTARRRKQGSRICPTQQSNTSGSKPSPPDLNALHPVQHPDGTYAVQNEDLEQHPQVQQLDDTGSKSAEQHPKRCASMAPSCLTDFSGTYQCRECSFKTQFRILINYHQKVRHKNRKLNWDLVQIFRDFRCPCCPFETASWLVLLKHTINKHFVVCDCCNQYIKVIV